MSKQADSLLRFAFPAIGFRTKLLLAMMVVVVGVTVATLYLAQSRLRTAQRRWFEQQFRAQVTYFSALQAARLHHTALRCEDFVKSVRLRALMRRVATDLESNDPKDLEAVRELLYRTTYDQLKPLLMPSPEAPASQHPAFFRVLDPRAHGLDPVAGIDAGVDDPKARQRLQQQLMALFRAQTDSGPQTAYLALLTPTGQLQPLTVLSMPIVDDLTGERLGAVALGYPIPEFDSRLPVKSGAPSPGGQIKTGLWLEDQLFSAELPAQDQPGIVQSLRARLVGPYPSEGDFSLNIGTEPFRAFFASLQGTPLAPVCQVSFYSQREALAEERQFFWRIVGFGGVALVCALFTSLLLAHGLAVPVKDLVAGTAAIGHGNLDVRVPVRGRDELGRLAIAFNEMAGGLGLQERLLDQVQDAILVRDLAGRIRFWNRGAQTLYGWSRDEALPVDLEPLINKKCLPRLAEAKAAVLAKGEWEGELNQVTKTEKSIVVNSRRRLLRQPDGSPDSILIVNTDITEKKALEQQFLRAQRVECIGRLAGGVAHDLNNVLAPIIMSLELLQLRYQGAKDNTLLETLQTGAQRGADIVKQVLTFARGVDGEKAPLQTRHLLKEMAKIITETFPKSISLRSEVPTDLWLVMGDATHLHQVLMNLCVNARDAMPQGGTLILSAENVRLDDYAARVLPGAKPGGYVLLRVADTGLGIPPENLEKIYDPFFTTKGPEQGTGLGLSTVLGIVRSHGGLIQVESKVGRGTEFKVYLPVAASETPLASPALSGPTFAPGKGEWVLLVEDEPAFREVTRQVLQNNGYRVMAAAEGREALALYSHNNPKVDLVLTDLAMPTLDGEAMIQELRQLDPEVKIVALTGTGLNLDLEERNRLGTRAILRKPVTAELLLRTLREALQ